MDTALGTCIYLEQRFSNFFQVGTTFISQNVLRTILLLSHFKANSLRFSTIVCDTQFMLTLFIFCLFWTNVQSKGTTRIEPEAHLWSADHSLRNADIEQVMDLYGMGNQAPVIPKLSTGSHDRLFGTFVEHSVKSQNQISSRRKATPEVPCSFLQSLQVNDHIAP
jgi:hypothetical protein